MRFPKTAAISPQTQPGPAAPRHHDPVSATEAPADSWSRTPHPARAGVFFGVAAYGLWGVFPLYFKAVKTVPPLEVLAHRIIWSLVFLAILIALRREWPVLRNVLASRRSLAVLAVTTLLIACNWLVFIWAVANNYVLQASLGYFINPLLNVLLGFVFLRERLRRAQTLSVGLAALGVALLTIAQGGLPLIALTLAATFGTYGLLRKTAHTPALVGLAIETGLLCPLALVFLLVQMAAGQAVFLADATLPRMNGLLLLAGVITAVPLWWFTEAARRLRLATLGFLQYLAPTGHFLLAVLAFGEPFTRSQAVAFILIWTALLLYSLDSVWARRATVVSGPE